MSYFEVTTTDNSGVERKLNYSRIELTEELNKPKKYKIWCNLDDSTGDFGTYPYYPRLVKIYRNNIISGTTNSSGAAANKLKDDDADFDGSYVGKIVHNTTDNTWARVTAVDSQTILSLNLDYMDDSEDYEFTNLIFKGYMGSKVFDDNQLIISNIDISSKIASIPSMNRYWRSSGDFKFRNIIYGAKDHASSNDLDDTTIKATPSVISIISASASDDGKVVELFGIYGTGEYGSEEVVINGGGSINTVNTFKEFWSAEARETLVGQVDYKDAAVNLLGSTIATTRVSSNIDSYGILGNGILYNTGLTADLSTIYDYIVYQSDHSTPRAQNYIQSGWLKFFSDKVNRLQTLNDLCSQCVTVSSTSPEWYMDYENNKLYAVDGVGSVRITEIVLETGVNCGDLKIIESPNVSNFQYVGNLNDVRESYVDSTSITYYDRKTIANLVKRNVIDDYAPFLKRIVTKYVHDFKYSGDIITVPGVSEDMNIVLGDTVHLTDRKSKFDFNVRVLRIVYNVDRFKGVDLTLTVSTNTEELPLDTPDMLYKLRRDVDSCYGETSSNLSDVRDDFTTIENPFTYPSGSLGSWVSLTTTYATPDVENFMCVVYYTVAVHCDGSGGAVLNNGLISVLVNDGTNDYPNATGLFHNVVYEEDVEQWINISGSYIVPYNLRNKTLTVKAYISNEAEWTVDSYITCSVDTMRGHTHNV